MLKVVSTEEMRSIEKAADAAGLTYDQMMQNAGKAIADALLERVQDIQGKRVVILVGSGNNGGDGLVVGYHLREAEAQVAIYLAKERSKDDPNLVRLQGNEVLIAIAKDDQRWRVLNNALSTADIVIDAVLGTGFELPLKGSAQTLLAEAKKILARRKMKPYVVAIDCPSGLDCDSGEIAEETLSADLTITLAAVKTGLLRFPGASVVGELVVGDIGIPNNQRELSSIKLELASGDKVSNWLPKRPRDAHKGTFGRVMVIAGSVNFPGAAGLSGLSAYRVGVGLVTMAVPSVVQVLIAPLLPEATWILLPHEMGVISENAVAVVASEIERTQSLVIGPGFGLDPTTKTFLGRFFGIHDHMPRSQIGFVHPGEMKNVKLDIPPCVIDADGLKLISEFKNWYSYLPSGTILTPHPGEMAVMTGVEKDEIQGDRIRSARKWAETWGHIVVLKGAFTVVASPDGRAAVIPIATPALARAGTGDVLAGVIAGLRAQGVGAYEAAVLGSYIHGRAGEIAALNVGTPASVLAGDVADAIPEVLQNMGG